MATIQAILDAIQTRLDTIDGLNAHANLPGNIPQLPAALPEWQSTDYHEAMADGLVRHEFRIRVLVSTNADTQSQQSLLGYIDPGGAATIKEAVEGGTPVARLGGTVHSVMVERAQAPAIYEYGGQKYFGADWLTVVYDTGV